MSYTEQQIQDFCKTAEHTAQYNRMSTLEVALQLIKQLKDQLATADKHIGWLKAAKIRLNKSIKIRDGAMDDLIDLEEVAAKKLDTTQAENERLKEFVRPVIEQECWSLIPLDGGDLQELAEKLGLIAPCVATEEDVDDECDFEVGDTIFKFSAMLKGTKP